MISESEWWRIVWLIRIVEHRKLHFLTGRREWQVTVLKSIQSLNTDSKQFCPLILMAQFQLCSEFEGIWRNIGFFECFWKVSGLSPPQLQILVTPLLKTLTILGQDLSEIDILAFSIRFYNSSDIILCSYGSKSRRFNQIVLRPLSIQERDNNSVTEIWMDPFVMALQHFLYCGHNDKLEE